MQWHNLPSELRALTQWVVSGPNKVPITPRTGQAADPTDHTTWGTFEEAVHSGYKHIGFVFTANDPYAVIDLDNKVENPATPEQLARHELILKHFESYTERSVSGRGYHILIKGTVPAGMNRDHVEIYSWGRYMICTGDVVRQAPITDYSELLLQLWSEMKQQMDAAELIETASSLTDKEIVNMAMEAVNADKFNDLCKGDWQAMGYPSQSEADLALLSILSFYSQSNEQVRRLFRCSNLGKREKALRNDKYIDYALEKIRAKQPPPLDFSELTKQAIPKPEIKEVPKVPEVPKDQPKSPPVTQPSPPKPPEKLKSLPLPPGLVGEMAHYFYQTSIRPVPDISLAASIALAAGVCGRSYNISGTGLNQYLVLVARTGSGKEGASSAINNLISAVKQTVPMVDDFIGPSTFASGQALIKVLDKKPCFVSVLGEFGLTLQQLCDPNATSAQLMLRKVLLDLYTKSGWSQVLRPSVYSDVEKNTQIVQAPNVTIFGETTPETFFEGLDSSHIADGLIPRFSIIQYMGHRPPRNRNANCLPPPALIQRFADFATVALTTAQNRTSAAVATDSQAQSMLDEFDTHCDNEINGSNNDVEKQVWNRAHLKALKLSALLAVGVNFHQPVVTKPLAEWAIDFVRQDVSNMADRFKTGDVGRGDSKLVSDLKTVIDTFLHSTYTQVKTYGVELKMYQKHVIPYSYFIRKTAALAAFRKDKRGSTGALKSSLQDLCDSNLLIEIPSLQLFADFGARGRAWIVGPAWRGT